MPSGWNYARKSSKMAFICVLSSLTHWHKINMYIVYNMIPCNSRLLKSCHLDAAELLSVRPAEHFWCEWFAIDLHVHTSWTSEHRVPRGAARQRGKSVTCCALLLNYCNRGTWPWAQSAPAVCRISTIPWRCMNVSARCSSLILSCVSFTKSCSVCTSMKLFSDQ